VAAGLAMALPARADSAPIVVEDKVYAVERHGIVRFEGGHRFRIPDILIPQIPEPYGFTAYARLKDMLIGKSLSSVTEHDGPDRFGVPGGYFQFTETGDSVAGKIVSEGLARVRPTGVFGGDMHEAEDEARTRGRGLWALQQYSIRNPAPDALAQDMESFQIVEGVVTDVRRRAKVTYVNFGSDWRTDTTAVLPNWIVDQREMDITALPGARVQFRGFVEMVNGPSVWVDHPDAFRVLS